MVDRVEGPDRLALHPRSAGTLRNRPSGAPRALGEAIAPGPVDRDDRLVDVVAGGQQHRLARFAPEVEDVDRDPWRRLARLSGADPPAVASPLPEHLVRVLRRPVGENAVGPL